METGRTCLRGGGGVLTRTAPRRVTEYETAWRDHTVHARSAKPGPLPIRRQAPADREAE